MCNLKLTHGSVVTFADDTVLFFSGNGWAETNKYAEEGFRLVTRWLDRNLLTLNVKKTKYITFSIRSKGQPHQSAINIKAHYCNNNDNCDCLKLESTNEIKYLGILIDQSLNWKPQIKALTGRIRKLLFVFKTLRHICDANQIISVYYALCQSITTYCISSWGGCPKSTIITAERAQRAILKLITFKPRRYSTSLLYKELPVLSVRQCYLLKICQEQHCFPPDQTLGIRRSDRVYKIPKCRTKFAQHFSNFMGPYIYNNISKKIELQSLNAYSYKMVVKEFIKIMTYDEIENLIRA